MSTRCTTNALLLVLASSILAGCTDEEKPVSYQQDVLPILQENCMSCHVEDGAGYKKSGLSMATYEDLMEGTRYGPVIVPGDSLSSTFIRVVAGETDASIHMPHGQQPLTEQQLDILKTWVEQGAKNN